MNNCFTSIKTVPRYMSAVSSLRNDSLKVVNNENHSFPQISNLVSFDGITLEKNEDNSITIGCTTTHDFNDIDLIENAAITLADLSNSTFTPDGILTNVDQVVETSTHVDITGANSLQSSNGHPTGTISQEQNKFFVNINHSFLPEKSYNGDALIGGVVGFYTEDNKLSVQVILLNKAL